jgi:hypothetical protein
MSSHTDSNTTCYGVGGEVQPGSYPCSRHLSLPAFIGISIGAPLGLIAIALLLWIARRHRKSKANTTPTVYFSSDPIELSTTRVFPQADLEAATTESQNEFIEIESFPAVVPADMIYHTSQTSDFESASINSNRVSALTTTENNRWSAVSSLRSSWYPSRLTAPAPAHTAEVGPAATDLQIASQQHYDPSQHYYS